MKKYILGLIVLIPCSLSLASLDSPLFAWAKYKEMMERNIPLTDSDAQALREYFTKFPKQLPELVDLLIWRHDKVLKLAETVAAKSNPTNQEVAEAAGGLLLFSIIRDLGGNHMYKDFIEKTGTSDRICKLIFRYFVHPDEFARQHGVRYFNLPRLFFDQTCKRQTRGQYQAIPVQPASSYETVPPLQEDFV